MQAPNIEALVHGDDLTNFENDATQVTPEAKATVSTLFFAAFFKPTDTTAQMSLHTIPVDLIMFLYEAVIPRRFHQRKADFGKQRIKFIESHLNAFAEAVNTSMQQQNRPLFPSRLTVAQPQQMQQPATEIPFPVKLNRPATIVQKSRHEHYAGLSWALPPNADKFGELAEEVGIDKQPCGLTLTQLKAYWKQHKKQQDTQDREQRKRKREVEENAKIKYAHEESNVALDVFSLLITHEYLYRFYMPGVIPDTIEIIAQPNRMWRITGVHTRTPPNSITLYRQSNRDAIIASGQFPSDADMNAGIQQSCEYGILSVYIKRHASNDSNNIVRVVPRSTPQLDPATATTTTM